MKLVLHYNTSKYSIISSSSVYNILKRNLTLNLTSYKIPLAQLLKHTDIVDVCPSIFFHVVNFEFTEWQ